MAGSPQEPPPETGALVPTGSGPRRLIDSLVALLLAVILFRTFQVEGYMISTGSMAPALLGYHKRVDCPACGTHFTVGVKFDDETDGVPEEGAASARTDDEPVAPEFADDVPSGESIVDRQGAVDTRDLAVCPNCGYASIDLTTIGRNQGDQLLVHKNAFLNRDPERWEVVVFRNPQRPTQAYVKRVAGRPGETVRIAEGDLYIDDRLARKPLKVQRAMRILVYDNEHRPEVAGDWQPRWIEEAANDWTATDGGFAFGLTNGRPDDDRMQWIVYRHWIRGGGGHRTQIPVPADVDLTTPSLFPLRYDEATGRLSCVGALTAFQRDRILRVGRDERFQRMVADIYERSHEAPITDDYGYSQRGSSGREVVRDLMIAFNAKLSTGTGKLSVQMTDGLGRYTLTVDVSDHSAELHDDTRDSRHARVRLNPQVLAEPVQIEMSLIDRQVLVAINGERVFVPLKLDPLPADAPAPRRPVRIGAAKNRVTIDGIKLYRDVYYTDKGAAKHPHSLADDEFYMLGDNSPDSFDSRVWPRSGVPRRLLMGKPFVVHLPSRPGRFRIAGREFRIRIPDLARIRYIR